MTTLIERINGTVESPIEDEVMRALSAIAGDCLVAVPQEDVKQIGNLALNDEHGGHVFVCLQAPVGRYRCDFLLTAYATALYPMLLVVECDGAEFHQANNRQIERDRARDRWFRSKGIRTLRFSGREITRDPYKCAHRALRIVTGQPDNGASFNPPGVLRVFPDFDGINARSQDYSNRENFPFLGDTE